MSGQPTTGDDPALPYELVANEFAEIAVSVNHDANGPRLRLEDLRTGRVHHLDPLELETIVWLPEQALQELLDPSANRWSGSCGDRRTDEPQGVRDARDGELDKVPGNRHVRGTHP